MVEDMGGCWDSEVVEDSAVAVAVVQRDCSVAVLDNIHLWQGGGTRSVAAA